MLRRGNMRAERGYGIPNLGGLRPPPHRAFLGHSPQSVQCERKSATAQREVAAENRLAAMQGFDPHDPLWILAERAAAAIEGGRAAVLPPERRARLLATGARLGLRPFDSHLVIAIVQDGARSGERVGDATRRRLGLLRRGTGDERAAEIWLSLAMAGLIAAGMVLVFLGWLGA